MGNLIGEIDGMRLYLNKNHRYWIGHRHINKKYGLTYTNKDWQNDSEFMDTISYLYGNCYYDSIRPKHYSGFGKADYLNRLSDDRYEFIQLAAHSDYYYHCQFSTTSGNIYGNEIYNHNIDALGINLFCCSACCWTEDNQPNHAFLGGDYVYSPNSEILCAVGCTKAGGMYQFRYFYPQLGNAKTMGQALVYWWRHKYLINSNIHKEISWNFGLTIIGDPLVNFYHCTNSTCEEYVELSSYGNSSSPLSYNLANGKIIIPQNGSYSIPSGKHCILNAPTVEINGPFECPQGATLEILNEGCKDNCEE